MEKENGNSVEKQNIKSEGKDDYLTDKLLKITNLADTIKNKRSESQLYLVVSFSMFVLTFVLFVFFIIDEPIYDFGEEVEYYNLLGVSIFFTLLMFGHSFYLFLKSFSNVLGQVKEYEKLLKVESKV